MARSHAATVGKVCSLIDEKAALISPRGSSADPAGQEANEPDRARFQSQIELVKELNVMNKEVIVPMLQLIENYDLDQKVCERAYRPDVMERNLKIEADIDKRIEKAISRLVTVKEYKKFYGAKDDKAPPAEVIILPAKASRNSGKA